MVATHELFNNALGLAVEEALKLHQLRCRIASLTRISQTAPFGNCALKDLTSLFFINFVNRTKKVDWVHSVVALSTRNQSTETCTSSVRRSCRFDLLIPCCVFSQ